MLLRTFTIAITLLSTAARASDPWIHLKSENFELFTTTGEHAGGGLLRHFEQVRSFFLQGALPGGKIAAAKPVTLIAFRNEEEMAGYCRNRIAFAFFQPGANRHYIAIQNPAADHFPVATHQYLHLLIQDAVPNVPLWLNEGLAHLYSTLEITGDRVVVGKPVTHLANAAKGSHWIALRSLLATPAKSMYDGDTVLSTLFNGESWALVHMLNFDERYKKSLRPLLAALRTMDSATALEKACGRPLDQIEHDLTVYVQSVGFNGSVYSLVVPRFESSIVTRTAGLSARLALADLLASDGSRSARAQAEYTEIARDYPDRWELEMEWGAFFLARRDTDNASTHLARAVELAPAANIEHAEGTLENVGCLGKLAMLDLRIAGSAVRFLVLDLNEVRMQSATGEIKFRCGPQSRTVVMEYQPLPTGARIAGVARGLRFD